uniref:Amine oxidase domain-containing protein n=1 Tax=Octactis speculum TaxID=3111310 RepID=A0A7S2FWC7_9STRA
MWVWFYEDDFWDERGAGNKGCICILAVVEYEWFAKFTAHEKNQKVHGNGDQSGERTVQVAGEPIVPLQAHSVPKSSGEDLEKGYNELKDKLKARLLRTLTDQYPKVKGHIALSDLSTPLTVNRYLGATRGEFNGLEHGHNRFLAQVQRTLRPKTPIRGLYLTGQDVTQQGLFSAMKAGVMTVFVVSKLAFIRFLPALIKDRFFM